MMMLWNFKTKSDTCPKSSNSPPIANKLHHNVLGKLLNKYNPGMHFPVSKSEWFRVVPELAPRYFLHATDLKTSGLVTCDSLPLQTQLFRSLGDRSIPGVLGCKVLCSVVSALNSASIW